ncbi:MAG: hypothetical protein E4G98_05810 [Promethearchaeota archaeon]|nr:MAG: hypothetical protein E4G98_05810 [Candidatus Lokiarchaeota archaeon]
MLFSISNPPNVNPEVDDAAQTQSSGYLPKWKILGEYIPEKLDSPTKETIEEVLIRYFSELSNTTLNIRLYPFKYYVFPINPEHSLLLVYILDARESVEIVQISPDATIELVQNCSTDAVELPKTLEQLYYTKNRILLNLKM